MQVLRDLSFRNPAAVLLPSVFETFPSPILWNPDLPKLISYGASILINHVRNTPKIWKIWKLMVLSLWRPMTLGCPAGAPATARMAQCRVAAAVPRPAQTQWRPNPGPHQLTRRSHVLRFLGLTTSEKWLLEPSDLILEIRWMLRVTRRKTRGSQAEQI